MIPTDLTARKELLDRKIQLLHEILNLKSQSKYLAQQLHALRSAEEQHCSSFEIDSDDDSDIKVILNKTVEESNSPRYSHLVWDRRFFAQVDDEFSVRKLEAKRHEVILRIKLLNKVIDKLTRKLPRDSFSPPVSSVSSVVSMESDSNEASAESDRMGVSSSMCVPSFASMTLDEMRVSYSDAFSFFQTHFPKMLDCLVDEKVSPTTLSSINMSFKGGLSQKG